MDAVPTQIVYTCRLHNTGTLSNISNCEMGNFENGRHFHIVSFKSPISFKTPIKPEEYLIVRNADSSFIKAYELFNPRCLCVLYDIGNVTEEHILLSFIVQLIQYFGFLSKSNIIHKLFKSPGSSSASIAKVFLQTITNVNEDLKITYLFRHLQVHDTSTKQSELRQQSIRLVDILLALFFRDLSKGKAANLNICSPTCKFKRKSYHFSKFDYLHFHDWFCKDISTAKDNKYNILLNIVRTVAPNEELNFS
jgi:hypothetical protein